MGRIVVTEFVSLDGVVEDPGGSRGLQARRLETLRDRARRRRRQVQARRRPSRQRRCSLAVLPARRPPAAWPSREGEFADKFNNMPKYVVTSTLDEAEWRQHDPAQGRPGRGGVEAEAAPGMATSSSTAVPGSSRA